MSRDERAAERVPALVDRTADRAPERIERPNERIGRYEVLRKIATGGMAELFLAKHVGVEGFEKLVAIKRILAHLAYDEEFVNMFRDEARLVAKLAHPNIVEIHDLGKSSDSYFIAMEYIAGRNLATVAKRARNRGQGMPPVQVARCLAQACEALYYAHTRLDEKGRPMGIVHRDVSPQNIIVSFSGNVKLVDFGIAKAATKIAHTRAGVLKGKYAYMSPEQIRGEEIDARSDVFAVGIVLFELLCGRRPFEKETAIQTLKSIVQEPHVDPRTLLPSLPDGLAAIINRCLVKRRDQRYQSAQEAQVALEDFVAASGERVNNASIGAWMTGLFADELDRQRVGTVNVKGLGEVLLPPSERHEPSEELDVSVEEDSAEPPAALGARAREDSTGAAPIPGTSIRGGGSLREPTIEGRHALLEEGVIGHGGALAALPDEATQHAVDVRPVPTVDLGIGAVHHGPIGHLRPAYAEVDRGAATVPPGTAPSTRPRPASPAREAYDDGLTQAATSDRLASLRALSRPPERTSGPDRGSRVVSEVTDLGPSAFGLPPSDAALVERGEDAALGSEDPTDAPDDDLWGDKTTADPVSAAEIHDDEIQFLEPDARLEPGQPFGAGAQMGDAEWSDATRRGGRGFGFEPTLGADGLAARGSYAPPLRPSLEPWGEKTTANAEDPAEGGAQANGVRLVEAANWSDVSRGTIDDGGALGEEATSDWGTSEESTVGATDAWRVPQPTSNVLRLGELPLPPSVDAARNVEFDSATVAATSGRLRDAGFVQPPAGAFAFDVEAKPESAPEPAPRAAIGALKLGKAPAVPRGGVREAPTATAPSSVLDSVATPMKPASSNEVSPRARSLGNAPPRAGSVTVRPSSTPPYPSEDVIRSAQRSGVELLADRAPDRAAAVPDRGFSLGGPERPAMPRAASHLSTENEGPLPPGGALLTPLSVESSMRPAPIKPLVGADPLASIGSTRVPPASVSLSEMLLDSDEGVRGSQPLKPASMIRGTPMGGGPARSTAGATLPPPARGSSYAGGLGLPEAGTLPPGSPSPHGYGAYGQAPIGGVGLPGTTAGVAGAAGRLTELRDLRRAPSRGGSLVGLPTPLAEGVAPSLGTPGMPQRLAPPRARLTRSQAIIIALSAVIVAALLGALLFLRFRAPSLEITTQPPGAQVYVADRLMEGVTPLSFSIEPEVDYPVRVVRAGFETHNQTVRLPRGKRAWTATINLRPLAGSVGAGTSTASAPPPPR